MPIMPSTICIRCLARCLPPIETSLPPNVSARAFSTTSSLSRTPPAPKKTTAVRAGAKQGKRLQLKKTARAQSGRPPAPGERKAYRKRIVLSNTNALEVPGLQQLGVDTLRQSGGGRALHAHQGKVLGLADATVDALRALETFQPTQGWSLFRRPATLVRRETGAVADAVAGATGDEKRTARVVLDGGRGSGKSVLLLQAQAMGLLKGCLVIHFPEGQDLVNAHTSYQPLDTPGGTVYVQPHSTARLLSNLAKANHALLSTLRLSTEHNLPIPIQPNTSLARFAELGAEDHTLAWPIWTALWSELTAPATADVPRPPLVLSLDGLNHIMRPSAYLDPDAKPIHAHDLALVRTFTDFLSGSRGLPNGGLVLAATCASNKASSPTLDHELASRATPEGQTSPRWDPYHVRDERVAQALKGVEVLKVPGLSKTEARGVLDYYARSGMVRGSVTEELLSERWSLAGGGIIGEMERAAVRMRF